MFISLSILPFCLLLVHGVTSEDFRENKRVPRRHTQLTRSHNYNHPPSIDSYDIIPVTVVIDEQEPIKVKKINGKKEDFIQDEEKYLKFKINSGKTKNLKASPGNRPPSQELLPFAGVNDYEELTNTKPRSRSIKLPVEETVIRDAPEVIETKTGTKIRRRTKVVRKLRVNNVTKSDSTDNKLVQKETRAKPANALPRVDEPSLSVQQSYNRRKGLHEPVVPIVESENYVFAHSGSFHYSYESGDGTKAFEKGELKTSNGGAGNAVEGNFSYKDEDGRDVKLSYTADENGYRPVGDHLPTPPPIPPAIQRALDYLATKKEEPTTERVKKLRN